MKIGKVATTVIVSIAAATGSALIFSDSQSQLPQSAKETKLSSTKSTADQSFPALLTLDQAKSKGLATHTFPRQHNALVGEDGIKYLAFDTGKGYQLFIVGKNKKVPAKDGAYKLKDGGEVRAKGGMIVWSNAVINTRFPNPGYTSGVIGLG